MQEGYRWPEDSIWESVNPHWRTACYYMQEHFEIPVACCVLYIVVIFGGRRLMKNREAFDLSTLLGFWNVGLALFSITGSIYVIPPILHNLLQNGMTADMCDLTSEMANPWVFYFCLSKIPELLDTVFIVLRKRPLIFLHYYHHVATLMYCWDAWGTQVQNGGWFAGMNLIVHSVMYSYYAACAFGAKFSTATRLSITSLQILQMVAGTAIVVHNLVNCLDHKLNTYAALVMYISYMLLFVKLFVESMTRAPRKPEAPPHKSKPEEKVD